MTTFAELPTDAHELLNLIGRKRGCLVKSGDIDTEKVLRLVLTDFRSGKLGRVTLDEPQKVIGSWRYFPAERPFKYSTTRL